MKHEKLIDLLATCVKTCNYCANSCLNHNHVQEMVDCMRASDVCAEVCSALRHLLVIEYEEVDELVRYCIKVCDDCAAECTKHSQEHCVTCEKTCRDCSAACRAFLA